MNTTDKQNLLNGIVNNESAKISGEWIEKGERTIIHDFDNGCQVRINTTTDKYRFFYPSGKEIQDGRNAFKYFLTNFGVPFIRTNYNWREFIDSCELTSEEREDFDYLFEESDGYVDGFIRYGGNILHLADFVRFDSAYGSIPANVFPGNWDAYSPLGYGCGYVLKLSECGEAYRIGYYF
jgi:hypothetical protein